MWSLMQVHMINQARERIKNKQAALDSYKALTKKYKAVLSKLYDDNKNVLLNDGGVESIVDNTISFPFQKDEDMETNTNTNVSEENRDLNSTDELKELGCDVDLN